MGKSLREEGDKRGRIGQKKKSSITTKDEAGRPAGKGQQRSYPKKAGPT